MTTLSAGSSVTLSLKDGGQCSVATNGGAASVTITLTTGQTQARNLGPLPERVTFGPFSEGATVVITNQTAVLDYDMPGGNPVQVVTAPTGKLKIPGAQDQNCEQDIIVAGDSLFVFGEDFFTVPTASLATAITFDGTNAYVNFANHGLQSLQKIYVLNANSDTFCGEKVATRIDANNFSFPCTLPVGTVIALPDNGYGTIAWTGTIFMRQTGYAACNPFYVANARLGHPFRVVRNVAINSRTAWAMERAAVRDILSHPAPWVVTSGGANEPRVAGQSTAVAVAAAKSYLLKLLNGAEGYPGKKVIYGNWQPLYPGGAIGLQTIEFDRQMADWCASVGIIYVDQHSKVIDPTSTNGQALANYLAQIDGVHAAAPSAEAMADAHIAAWGSLVVPRRCLPTSAAESIANDSSSKQMYRNPLLLTATGGSNTSGLTVGSSVPANVTVSSPAGAVTGTLDTVARTVAINGDAYGNAVKAVVTGGTNAELQIKFTFTAGDFAAGDEIYAAAALDAINVSGANMVLCGLYLEVAAGTTRYFGDQKYGNGLGTDLPYLKDFRKTLVSPNAILNQAPSSISVIVWLKFTSAGSAVTIYAGRPAINKVIS